MVSGCVFGPSTRGCVPLFSKLGVPISNQRLEPQTLLPQGGRPAVKSLPRVLLLALPAAARQRGADYIIEPISPAKPRGPG